MPPVDWVGDDFESLSIPFSDLGSSCCCDLCSLDVSNFISLWVISWV